MNQCFNRFTRLSQSDFMFFAIIALALQIGCGQPVFETTECVEAREAVKRFYSFHIGNEMTPSPEYLEKRKRFLSNSLTSQLKGEEISKKDYFTQTEDFPMTFRAGKCETNNKDQPSFEVVLFWRTNEENIEKTILVETVTDGNKWLIDQVVPKN